MTEYVFLADEYGYVCVFIYTTGEASKWEKITYVGIVACSILAFVNLSKGHPHFEEPPVSSNNFWLL